MLALGHVATATVTARWANKAADLRWVILLTLLADLVDKPLGLVLFRETLNNGRVYFHSLFLNLLLTLLLVTFRKPLIYSLALWMHQLCDRMWKRPWAALWPLSGSFGFRDLPLDAWVYSVLSPYNLSSEAVGLLVVIMVAVRFRLYRRERFGAWLRSGRFPPQGA
ncbi:MAG: metal-dependent hydrolase [Acidobacteriota bacterium]